eukprot:6212145-Pleurochrysis_carterae.AAC.1
MHRHCSISREYGFNNATKCLTPIDCARRAQKYSLALYRLVRLPDSWCAPKSIGACCSSMAFCGSARQEQHKSESIASKAGRSSHKTLAQMAAPAQLRWMPAPNLPHGASI